MLEIYNSLSGKKEEFVPIEDGKIRMYVCGMTVYDYCHIGHARVLVVFDVISRFLRAQGYDLTYVRNITDIDDKIIQRANERKVTIDALTDEFIKAMHEDCEALFVLPPDQEPRATQSIDSIIAMVRKLEEKGFTYVADNGDVYYSVSQFEDYGKLSGRRLDDQIAGKRVAVDSAKRNPEDFVLWKSAKPEEPSWDSPWGPGRPGWHIECSAMSTDCLGDHFDIHGGGMDLKFPHHENEIAQTEGATGHKSVNYWIHNGFVEVDKEKMSKSLGNFFTVREVLKKYQAEEVRFFILNSHYRSPLNYSEDNFEKAKAGLASLYTALRGLDADKIDNAQASDEEAILAFNKVMNDDFNTAGAIAVLFDLAHKINKAKNDQDEQVYGLAKTFKQLALILGLCQRDAEAYLQGEDSLSLQAEEIEAMIQARNEARAAKNFAEADRIRDELLQAGIAIEDSPNGTLWRKA
jgi:cysteinyl-tRNA synthetase